MFGLPLMPGGTAVTVGDGSGERDGSGPLGLWCPP